MKFFSSLSLSLILTLIATVSAGKDLPKIAVWDLTSGDIKGAYAQDLTLILGSEVSKLGKYEVYSQENVRTLAGWTAERITLGCTDTKCLTALGQMDIAKLISGRVGKIGNRYSVSLSLFDTQNAKAEKMISEFCQSEDELIELVQVAVRKLLGVEGPPKLKEKLPEKTTTELTYPDKGKGYISSAEVVRQALEEEQLKKKSFFADSVTGMEFVFIKGGCFEMGDTFGDGGGAEKPVHEVCVDDFYLGKYEVTQGQWEKVMGNNPSAFKGRDNPVEQVSWNDVQEYIDRSNPQSGRKYRLPTEAEWEYAAKSGGKREKYSGTSQESELGQYAWYYDNSGNQTHPVGQKRPNGLGLYDMTGNIWEWCADWYDENYYKNSPKDNPGGPPSGESRVLRGGSYSNSSKTSRASQRGVWGGIPPFSPVNWIGFRLGLSAR